MSVKIIEVKKENKEHRQQKTLPFELAEYCLSKSKSWELHEDSKGKYQFKDGVLVEKATKPSKSEKAA